jgi:competence ComEA-like helix-hairpin-helix protein
MCFTFIKNKFCFLFVFAFSLTACQQVKPQNQALNKGLKPLPQDIFIQVYFNHAKTSEYQEYYRKKKRLGDDLEQQIIDVISQAKSSIDIAVQEFRLPKVAQALAAKRKAGIKVRLILENTYNRAWSKFSPQEVAKLKPREREKYQEFHSFVDINKDGKLSLEEISDRDALVILENAKIPKSDDTSDGSRGSDLMHHKFVIVDNRIVVVTSANFTPSDIHGDFKNTNTLGNANNLVKIDSPDVASIFTEEFNLMWGNETKNNPKNNPKNNSNSKITLTQKFGIKKPIRLPKTIKVGDSKVTIHFSPTSPTKLWINSSNGLINKILETATQSVDMALFVFSEQRFANTLETKHEKNTKIRVLIEKSFAYRPYSEGLDMMGFALADKCKYELDNKPWYNPLTTVAVPDLPKGDLVHHKFGIIDNKIVITGSHNWSEAANFGNDETLLIIENPVIAAHYNREFERLYQNSRAGLPQKIQQKIAAQKQECSDIKAPSSLDQVIPNKSIQQINVNSATLAELETIPGVGKKMAERIIIARQEKPFTTLKDLERVKGISYNKLYKLKDYITL